MSKKIILRICATLCAFVVIALAAPSFINWNSYKEPLLELISKHTNFIVAIDGDIKLSLLPSPQLSVGQVSVKETSQTKNEEPFVRLKQLSFAVDFWPLLSKKISIRSVELIEPVISIIQKSDEAKKNTSVTIDVAKSDKSVKKEIQAATTSKREESDGLSLDIAKASIVNGVLTLIDSKSKKKTEIKAINLSGGFSFTHGFDMKASANLDGMQANGTIKSGAFLDGLPSTVDAACTLKQDKGLEGALTISATHKEGIFTVKASSDAIKVPMQIQLGTQTIDLAKGIQFSADATMRDQLITINALKAKVADISLSGKGVFNSEKNSGSLAVALNSNLINASGTVGIDLSQTKPMLTIDLVLPKVDDKVWTKTEKASEASDSKSHNEAPHQTPKERWSKDPIDLSALQLVNADVALAVDTLRLSDIEATKLNLRLTLNNGVATIKQLSVNVFDGAATLTGTLDSKTGHLTTDAKLTNMNALKLPGVKGSALKAGRLNLSTAITTKATSMFAVINHLNGTASLDVSKGIVEGVDIKQFIADLKTTKDIAGLSKLKASFDRKADMAFNHVRGDIKLVNGIAHTRNFEIDMNEGVITSVGTVDLPNWVLALSSNLTVRDAKNIPNLSVNITGPIDQPNFALDMDQLQKALIQLATNQLTERAKDTVKKKIVEQLGGAVKGDMAEKVGGEAAKVIGKLLPGLFG
ncbi:MAG: AsmA family protein [Pseudomonadota bacterium]